MNDNLFYDPSDLDIGDILKEAADPLIETLDLPETQLEIADNENELLDMLMDSNWFEASAPTEQLQKEQLTQNGQLPTPSPTPSIKPVNTPSSSPSPMTTDSSPATRNTAPCRNDISADFNTQNIVQGS